VGVSGFVEVQFCWGGAWRSVRIKERLEWGCLVVSGGCYRGGYSWSMVSSCRRGIHGSGRASKVGVAGNWLGRHFLSYF